MDQLNGGTEASAGIAIIGIACRFPGADGPDRFWRLLMDRADAVGDAPPERFGPGDQTSAGHGGHLGAIDEFDAAFFDMAPREAQHADPQLRLFLEVAWEAIEDAGLNPDQLAGSRTGVFVGQATSNYWELLCRHADPDIYSLVGSEFRASLPGRVSFHLDLRGPSVSVDTACSASLTAAHMACQSMRLGESTTALVGGVNLALLPHEGAAFAAADMLASDGRCKFGDADADGFVRSDGIGVVVLKPLPAAVADGDRVYAVVHGSAVSNDGRSNGLLMTPSVAGQEQMLRQALEAAGVDAADVDYVEAHGTGTRVGDLVELTALGNVLGEGRPAGRPCLVGSVKSNIGHTEAAAGIAGLIKAALCVHHRVIPPTLHVREPNPAFGWDKSALQLPTELRRLTGRNPVVAGVSSLGISGTNVHVVLGEQVSQGQAERGRRTGLPAGDGHLFTLSARSPEALQAAVRAAADFLSPGGAGRELNLADICCTAARRRKHHENRLVAIGPTHDALASTLRRYGQTGAAPGVIVDDEVLGAPARIAFVFPGQGSQWTGMARDLLSSSEVFRTALRECSEAIEAETGWSVLERLAAGAPLSDRADEIQPTLWAMQVALAALWRSFGVEPDLVIGHSMGEVAAACVAGSLTLPDAAAIICRRSRLAQQSSGRGAMVSVALSEAAAEAALIGYEDRVAVAATNSPTSTILSGDPAALHEITRDLDRRRVFHRTIQVSFASHSPQMDDLKNDLARVLDGVRPTAAGIPIWSTVLDDLTDGACFDVDYWVRNLREPVRFGSAVSRVAKAAPTVFVEISPHPVLVGAIQDCLRHHRRTGAAVASLRRDQPAWPQLRESLASVHVAGGRVDWRRLYPEGRPVRLPSYPWQRERYWFTESSAQATSLGSPEGHLARSAGPAMPIELAGDLRLLDPAGGTVAEMGNMRLQFVIRHAQNIQPQNTQNTQPSPPAQPVGRPTGGAPRRQPAYQRPTNGDGSDGFVGRVVEQIAQELSLPVGKLNLRRPLSSMGLDSLMASRLAGRLRIDPGVEVLPSALLGRDPLADVIERIRPSSRPAQPTSVSVNSGLIT